MQKSTKMEIVKRERERYLSFIPWKFCGESGDEVEDAPAEDDGVVDVVHVAADQHAVTQAAEDGRHSAVNLEVLSVGSFLLFEKPVPFPGLVPSQLTLLMATLPYWPMDCSRKRPGSPTKKSMMRYGMRKVPPPF